MSTSAHIRQPLGAIFRSSGLMLLIAAGCQAHRPPTVAPAVEAVNVGYGTRDSRELTGAISSATYEELSDQPVSRVEEMLEGRFPGLTVVRLPNGDYRVRIRGGRADPLVVIDGIPSPLGLPNPLQDLTPTQIATLTVLKDAGSTAAFGSRGASGVILITTRRGR